jgi:hypothetical protein
MLHIIWDTKFRLITYIQLHHVHSTLAVQFHYIFKIHITCNQYWKILMFFNKTPPSDIYFNIIIVHSNFFTYNVFDIFKWHACSSIQEHNTFINISDIIIRIRNNSTTIMTQHKEDWRYIL